MILPVLTVYFLLSGSTIIFNKIQPFSKRKTRSSSLANKIVLLKFQADLATWKQQPSAFYWWLVCQLQNHADLSLCSDEMKGNRALSWQITCTFTKWKAFISFPLNVIQIAAICKISWKSVSNTPTQSNIGQAVETLMAVWSRSIMSYVLWCPKHSKSSSKNYWGRVLIAPTAYFKLQKLIFQKQVSCWRLASDINISVIWGIFLPNDMFWKK